MSAAGGFFDSFQAGRGIDLHDHRPFFRFEHVHAGEPQSQDAGGRQGRLAILGRQTNLGRGAAAVQIRSEFPSDGLPPHGGRRSCGRR